MKNMTRIIAMAGKGGVGKTTIGALLIRYLIEEVQNGPVLAVDLDPNSNLNELLGVKVKGTIGDARELIKKDVPQGITKDVWLEYKVHEAIVEGKGFDLLVMGRTEGPGCYCAVNSLAKRSIDTLKTNYPYVVVDNEAGMEHISRLVTQDIDDLIVISDATSRGIMTVRRIVNLVKNLNLNIERIHIIINRFRGEDENILRGIAEQNGLAIEGTVREDESIVRADHEGKTIFSMEKTSCAFSDAYRIFRNMLAQ